MSVMNDTTDPTIRWARQLFIVYGREKAIAHLRATWNINSTAGLEALIRWVNHFADLAD